MGVPGFIEDEIYQAIRDRKAIERVRQLTKVYWDTNLIPLSVYKELMEVLGGEQ